MLEWCHTCYAEGDMKYKLGVDNSSLFLTGKYSWMGTSEKLRNLFSDFLKKTIYACLYTFTASNVNVSITCVLSLCCCVSAGYDVGQPPPPGPAMSPPPPYPASPYPQAPYPADPSYPPASAPYPPSSTSPVPPYPYQWVGEYHCRLSDVLLPPWRLCFTPGICLSVCLIATLHKHHWSDLLFPEKYMSTRKNLLKFESCPYGIQKFVKGFFIL